MMVNSTKKSNRAAGGRKPTIVTSTPSATSRIKKSPKALALKKPGKASAVNIELQERIQQKAYELFQKRGCKPGYELFDWSMAEKLVKLETQREKLGAKKRFSFDSDEELNQKIQQKAYELYLSQGEREGNEAFNWALAQDLVLLENN